jgi:hypothetical protein
VAEIPVYKERRMYGINPETELPDSYLVSESYAGILRLSPNNSATLSSSSDSEYYAYEDTIKDFLTQQLLHISTSDGIMLDMRISGNEIEYSKLYVLGAANVPGIAVYTNLGSSFKLGNINMPITPNYAATLTESEEAYTEPSRENLSDTYLLLNEVDTDGNSSFAYKNADTFLTEIINDAIIHLSVVPTGSIHWIPINLEQYKKLIDKNPSINYHNSSHKDADPIIRDFLLCDGSQYNSEDFPELAKILNHESITYWQADSSGHMVQKREAAVKLATADSKGTFRVPDMRSMFIQYVIPTLEMAGKENNRVGDYEIDSSVNQRIYLDNIDDKHYHYIVLDNSITNQHNTKSFSNGSIVFQKAINGGINSHFPDITKNPTDFKTIGKPLAKYGSLRIADSAQSYGVATESCDPQACNFNPDHHVTTEQRTPVSYIYPPESTVQARCQSASSTCGYILSKSARYNYNSASLKFNEYIGASSWSIPMEIENQNIISDKLNYTANKDNIYQTKRPYVSYDAEMVNMIGYENTPEYYACLPLIKI